MVLDLIVTEKDCLTVIDERASRKMSMNEKTSLPPRQPSLETIESTMTTGKAPFRDARRKHSSTVPAERYFRRALELSPESAEAMAHVGYALVAQGRWKEAKEWYERALAADPAYEPARRWHRDASLELR